MPEPKGRKHKRDRDRSRRRSRSDAAPIDSTPTATLPPSPQARSQPARSQQPVPPASTRATGVMLAFVTAIGAVWVIYNAVSGDRTGADLVGRIAAGVFLFVVVVVVGVLSLAPEVARRVLRRLLTESYRIQEGDTVDSIARQFRITAGDVLATNPELLRDGPIAGRVAYIPRRRR